MGRCFMPVAPFFSTGRDLYISTHTTEIALYACANGQGALLGTPSPTYDAVAGIEGPVDVPVPLQPPINDWIVAQDNKKSFAARSSHPN